MYACESKINLNIIHESTLPQFYIIDCCYTYVLTYIYNIYLYINQDLASRDTCRSRGSPGYGQWVSSSELVSFAKNKSAGPSSEIVN